jgi:hypothetical protein
MGVVGVLTTLLLEEQFVTRPVLASRAVPGREVVGDQLLLAEGQETTA